MSKEEYQAKVKDFVVVNRFLKIVKLCNKSHSYTVFQDVSSCASSAPFFVQNKRKCLKTALEYQRFTEDGRVV